MAPSRERSCRRAKVFGKIAGFYDTIKGSARILKETIGGGFTRWKKTPLRSMFLLVPVSGRRALA
jgi:hypothetical protein